MGDIVEDKDKTETPKVAGTPEFTPIAPIEPPAPVQPTEPPPPVPPVPPAPVPVAPQVESVAPGARKRRAANSRGTGEQMKDWLGELCKLVGEVAHQAGHPELVRRADQLSATLEAIELA